MTSQPYGDWTTSSLIERITELEKQLREQSKIGITPSIHSKKTKKPKPIDPSKYSTRLIALKFAYLGAEYNGFEHHVGNATPLPTIEEEIWKALVKTRLIFPPSLVESGKMSGRMDWLDAIQNGEVPVDWKGAEYSKCGRTDRGVSAFGQVIGVRVRSARPVVKRKESAVNGDREGMKETECDSGGGATPDGVEKKKEDQEQSEFDDVRDELSYISLLNRLLPPTIRILAWCPSPPPNFSARYSCKERLYKYFFTIPAYLPSHERLSTTGESTHVSDGFMDIDAMNTAAAHLVGSHDFRNFCKIDPSKQLTSFTRTITNARVEKVAGNTAPSCVFGHDELQHHDSRGLYAFTVRGSAFLWHQVRCMVAVLFLVGQRLEAPSLVRELLDVATNPQRPVYEMASDKPLVLWDCTFSTRAGRFAEGELPDRHWDRGVGEDELYWIKASQSKGDITHTGGKSQRRTVLPSLWKEWRAAKINEILAAQLMDMVAAQNPAAKTSGTEQLPDNVSPGRVFLGDDDAEGGGRYISVMQRSRLETVEVINAKYLTRKKVEAT